MKRIDQLTFTRFIMILLVLFYHNTGAFYISFINFFPFSALLTSAPTAVSYLYVLSGFVMALVYFRPGEKFDTGGYWRARVTRIYPLYLISFLLICVYYFDSLFRIKPQKIVANLFVLQAWIPAYSQSFNYSSWSMTVEFFFYAVFPFFVLWAYRRSTRALIWGAVALWFASQLVHFTLWVGYFPARSDIIVYFPLFHLNSFVMGAAAGVWYLREGRDKIFPARLILSLLAGSFLFIAVYTVVSTDILPSLPHRLEPMAGLLAPLQALFILALALDNSKISSLFQKPALVNLGETSYAIYILHVPVFWLYERYLQSSGIENPEAVFNVTFLPMMILIGLGAHFLVDIPLRRRFKKFLENINVPLFLLDLAIAGLTAFFIFQLRFGGGREYRSYREMERLVFWVAFFASPALALIFGAYRRGALEKTGVRWMSPILLSVTASALIVSGAAYLGYATAWFENFPRSVFVIQWLIVLSLSLVLRSAFRAWAPRSSLPA